MYKCLKCGRLIGKRKLGDKWECPYCRGKILEKVRKPIVRTVKAR